MQKTVIAKILMWLIAISLLCCESAEKSNSKTTAPPATASKLDDIVLTDHPEDAITITEARKNPTPGTKVVMSGKVLGNIRPLVESRALVTLGDPNKLISCDLVPGDDCPTPWDVCCADPDVVDASTAVVQVLDEEGKLIREGLRGLAGLKELSLLVVVGEVADASNAENFLVNATGIHVASPGSAKDTQPSQ